MPAPSVATPGRSSVRACGATRFGQRRRHRRSTTPAASASTQNLLRQPNAGGQRRAAASARARCRRRPRRPRRRCACVRALAGGKGVPDRAEARGDHARAADPLQHAGRDEDRHRRARAPQRRWLTASHAALHASTRRRPRSSASAPDRQQSCGEPEAHAAERPRLAGDAGVKGVCAVADGRDDERAEVGRARAASPSAATVSVRLASARGAGGRCGGSRCDASSVVMGVARLASSAASSGVQ